MINIGIGIVFELEVDVEGLERRTSASKTLRNGRFIGVVGDLG